MSIKVVHNYLKKKMVSSFVFAFFIKYLSSIANLPCCQALSEFTISLLLHKSLEMCKKKKKKKRVKHFIMPCLFCEKGSGLLCKQNIAYDTVSQEKICANTDSDGNIGHSLF